MSATNATTVSTVSAAAGPISRWGRIGLWTLQILAAAAFLTAGGFKLAGNPMMVEVFDQIGIGQWFRYVTGTVEIVGGLAILVPSSAAFGGALLAITMLCAIATHLFVIGGNPGPAIVLLLITASVAWFRRASFRAVLRWPA
jgi:putative oxidoreductase